MLKGSLQTALVTTGIQTISSFSGTTEVGTFNGVVAYLNVTAASGTTPTLAVKLQDSPDKVTWYDIPGAAFTSMTTTGTQRISAINIGAYVRAAITITGTTPSFTTNIQMVGIN
ncbi:hypothetical protein QN355_11720 [Cryobacterium sp. 10S3]|uniref:hypothetical protein n=1 Tax=Cryobacterium sp. 10S3 TaxID=3048582 RepID=UPI002AC999AD|nr:hypothetical protein [Cryobacterium sp. 10S3]MEB0287222.1 hypothetical protein [Cryobacterium sp. 10S3]WPX14177.1 hypothetical protein RHM57_02040 [Cryobacterium sp. 10S3]